MENEKNTLLDREQLFDIDLTQMSIDELKLFETVDNAIFDNDHPKYVLLKNEFFTQNVVVYHNNQMTAQVESHRILYKSGELGGYTDSYDVLSQYDDCKINGGACAILGSKLKGSIIINGSAKIINSKISSSTSNEIYIRREIQIHDSEYCFSHTISTTAKIMYRNIWSPNRYKANGKVNSQFFLFPTAQYTIRRRRFFGGYYTNLGIGTKGIINPNITTVVHPTFGKITIDFINKVNIYLRKIQGVQINLQQPLDNTKTNIEKEIVPLFQRQPHQQTPTNTIAVTKEIYPSVQQPLPPTTTVVKKEITPSIQQSTTNRFTLDPYDSFVQRFDGESTVYRVKYTDGTIGGYIESPENIEDGGLVLDNAIVYGKAVISGETVVNGNAVIGGNGKLSWPMIFDHGHTIVTGDNLFKPVK